MVKVTLCCQLCEETLADCEEIAVSGSHETLGCWKPENAVLLEKNVADPSRWSVQIELPESTEIEYRYFVAMVDKKSNCMIVRLWESSFCPRSIMVNTDDIGVQDMFGTVRQKRKVSRGWLNIGTIIQFQLFPNALQMNCNSDSMETTRIKVQPVEQNSLQPILPTADAYTECIYLSDNDCAMRAQSEFGIAYTNENILIFQTIVMNMNQIGYLVKLYSEIKDSNIIRLIGYQHIFPDILQCSEGKFQMKMISPDSLSTVASLTVNYLVIKPIRKCGPDLRCTYVLSWDSYCCPPLEIGHRGLGRTFHRLNDVPKIAENTIGSFEKAAEIGADMVEMDVLLTSDLIPIIYHDYSVRVFCGCSPAPTGVDDLTQIMIKDLTYEQLKNLKIYQIVETKLLECPSQKCVKQEQLRLFPTLKDVLCKVNRNIGFNLEIKWPQTLLNGEPESIQTIDKNLFVDRILAVVQKYAQERSIFFSSFDANICTMLRLKQCLYPVLFLSSSMLAPKTEPEFADPRTQSLKNTLNLARGMELAGIVPNADMIETEENFVPIVHECNKQIFLWGDTLNNKETLDSFRSQRVDGIIYDRIDLLLTDCKCLRVEKEKTA